MKRSLIAQLASAIVAALAADSAMAQDLKRDPTVTAPPASAADYWTKERMESARPAEMGRADGARRHGNKEGRRTRAKKHKQL